MERIGYIGLGSMGKPMARNLMNAGYHLNLFSRTRAKVEDLIAAGATWCNSAKEIAETSDVVITNLPDSPDVEHAFAGKDGVFEGARPGMLFLDNSTISPIVTRRLAQQAIALGCEFLDAPVSGGDIGAQKATLTIMVGGNEAAFNRAMPILQALGKTITLMGGAGAGQITKAANQILTSVTAEAVAEALVFATKAGVDPIKVRQALLGGSANSRVLEMHGQKMLDHNFNPGFRLRLHRKDLDIVMQTGREYGMPLPVTTQVHEMMTALINAGRGDWDAACIVTHLENLAQQELKTS